MLKKLFVLFSALAFLQVPDVATAKEKKHRVPHHGSHDPSLRYSPTRPPTAPSPKTVPVTVNVHPSPALKLPSDARLKRDIVKVAELANGLHLYRYRYIWSDKVYVGVMAQEVAAIAPDATIRGADGYLRVDYGRLGLKLMTWNEWVARNGQGRQLTH